MRSTKAAARRAGVLYLLAGLPGVFVYLYLPSKFVVPGDAAATARRIAGDIGTYRLGLLTDLVGQIFLIALVLSLYNLLKDADRKYARLMVVLVAVGVAFQTVNALNLMAPLVLLNGASYWSVFTRPQLEALALGFLQLRGDALFVSQIFWGLWLFPFGMLVLKSGFFPSILGVLLIVACVAYVAASFAFLVVPAHSHLLIHLGQGFGGLGEAAITFWLLVMGVRSPAVATDSVNRLAPS